jgi:hypothetical protein
VRLGLEDWSIRELPNTHLVNKAKGRLRWICRAFAQKYAGYACGFLTVDV